MTAEFIVEDACMANRRDCAGGTLALENGEGSLRATGKGGEPRPGTVR